MIHEVKDEDGGIVYVISSHRLWMPGCYESRRAANYAFRFPWDELKELQQSINPGGIITFKMLQELRKKLNQQD